MAVKRMDNIASWSRTSTPRSVFLELGLTFEGRMPIEGDWAGRVTGVRGQRDVFGALEWLMGGRSWSVVVAE